MTDILNNYMIENCSFNFTLPMRTPKLKSYVFNNAFLTYLVKFPYWTARFSTSNTDIKCQSLTFFYAKSKQEILFSFTLD